MTGCTIFLGYLRYVDVSIIKHLMFKTSPTNIQPNMFSSPEMVMNKRQLSAYTNPASWFNRFYDLVVSRIDETVFKPLYSVGMGTPNVPVRLISEVNFTFRSGLMNESKHSLKYS